MKKHLILILLVLIALYCIFRGFQYIYYLKADTSIDSTMVAAWFSLAGVILFATALIYQIKEFKLQREELIKSVEAQTASSKALEGQKNIMLGQKTDAYLSNIVSTFVEYANNDKITNRVSGFLGALSIELNDAKFWLRLIRNEASSNNFYDTAKSTFDNYIHQKELLYFIAFTMRTLYEINKHKNKNGSQDYFSVLLLNQLEFKTFGILVLAEYLSIGTYPKDPKRYFSDKAAITHMLQCFGYDDSAIFEKLSTQIFDDIKRIETEPNV